MSEVSDLHHPHLSEEEAEAYAMSRLHEPQLAQVEDHLLVCGDCQAMVEAADEFVRVAREALKTAPVPARSTWKWSWLVPVMAVAATLIVIIGIPRNSSTLPEPVDVVLSSIRAETSFTAPAGKNLKLRVDASGLAPVPSHRLQVVDSSGHVKFAGEAKVEGDRAVANLNRALPAGEYWVRLYDSGGKLLREYALKLR